jgi:hypothetical protein
MVLLYNNETRSADSFVNPYTQFGHVVDVSQNLLVLIVDENTAPVDSNTNGIFNFIAIDNIFVVHI